MKRNRRLKFDDPEDIERPSTAFTELVDTLLILDFARRYYERINDKTSLRKAEEIRKLCKKLWYREEEEVCVLASKDSIKVPFKLEDPKNKK